MPLAPLTLCGLAPLHRRPEPRGLPLEDVLLLAELQQAGLRVFEEAGHLMHLDLEQGDLREKGGEAGHLITFIIFNKPSD